MENKILDKNQVPWGRSPGYLIPSVRFHNVMSIGSLESALGNRGQTDPAKKKEIHHAFKLALGIEEIFKNGSPMEKKELLSETQSNLTIKGKKLNVTNAGTYGKIINGLLLARAENPSFEPRKYGSNKGQTEAFASVCPTLLRG